MTVDPTWEQVYSSGHQINRYPFDAVVSFVHRYRPTGRPAEKTTLLEVGCGVGNNVWFAAREGFRVAGIDASPTAVHHARSRLAADGLDADLRVGDMTRLPFEDNAFDLAIDRGALTCLAFDALVMAVAEVRRVLRAGGAFFLTPASDRRSSPVSSPDEPRPGDPAVHALDRARLEEALHGWEVARIEHVAVSDETTAPFTVHGEWRVVARKPVR